MNKQRAHVELSTNGSLTSCGFTIETKMRQPDGRFKTVLLLYLGQFPFLGWIPAELKEHFHISSRFRHMDIEEIEAVKAACLERRRRYRAQRLAGQSQEEAAAAALGAIFG